MSRSCTSINVMLDTITLLDQGLLRLTRTGLELTEEGRARVRRAQQRQETLDGYGVVAHAEAVLEEVLRRERR